MSNGEMAPLSQFLTLTRTYGAESLSRFNMYNSIAVNAMPADGYSTGDAIRAVQETASTSLPKGYGYDYGGITREENQQSGTTAIIFGIFADVPISLTHYGNGCAPIYYGAGYVSQSEWWKNGFVMTTITTVIYLTIGAAWWKVIGLW